MFTVPSTTVTDLMATVSSVFSETWVLVVLAIGIPLAFYIIHLIKGLFGRAKKA